MPISLSLWIIRGPHFSGVLSKSSTLLTPAVPDKSSFINQFQSCATVQHCRTEIILKERNQNPEWWFRFPLEAFCGRTRCILFGDQPESRGRRRREAATVGGQGIKKNTDHDLQPLWSGKYPQSVMRSCDVMRPGKLIVLVLPQLETRWKMASEIGNKMK